MEAFLDRELKKYFPEEIRAGTDSVEEVATLILRRLGGKTRVLMMPAGDFAVAFSRRLKVHGIQVAAFLDTFKVEDDGVRGPVRIFRPEAAVDLDFDAVLIATPSIPAQEAMRDQLVDVIPRRKEDIHTLVDVVSVNFNDLANCIADKMNRALSAHPKGRRVCVVSSYMNHGYLKRMYHLKSAGIHITIVTGSDRINNSVPLQSYEGRGFFDACQVIELYDVLLPLVLAKLEIDLVHAIASTDSPESILKALRLKKTPFVVEYWDFKQILFDTDEAFGKIMTPKQWVREKAAWSALFMESDGIILKDSPEIIDAVSKQLHHRPKKWIQFLPYASAGSPKKRKEGEPNPGKEKYAVIYAGTVINNPAHHAYAHHKSLFHTAKALTAQGIRFGIVNASENGGDEYRRYVDLSEQEPLFDYYAALPIDELATVLSTYDMGWFGFDFSNPTEGGFFLKTTFGSKIFSYLEAGLPVLVSKEFGYMYRWVEEKGVGKGFDYADIDHFRDLMDTWDLDEMGKKISEMFPEYSMENQIHRLIDFYGFSSA